MLLHGDLSHLLINSVWLLVFGTPIARRLGAVRFLLFTLFCGLSGALVFWIFNPGLDAPMIGASGAISGLMGGLFRFLFNALDQRRSGSITPGVQDVPRMSLRQTLADRRAMGTIAIWVALNVALATGLNDMGAETVAWEAHLGGFLAGLCAFGLFDGARDTSEQHPAR
jgi:membrane associated rhomboid family serine protease